jgi:nitrogen regulatory protein PII
VVSAMADAAFTGSAGDGIVSIENVEDVYNIASKKRGSEAL